MSAAEREGVHCGEGGCGGSTSKNHPLLNSEKRKNIQTFGKQSQILTNLAEIQDIKTFKTISLSQETIQYPYFKF